MCCILYKLATLTEDEDVRDKMSEELREDYITDSVLLSFVLIASVVGALAFAALLLGVQVRFGIRRARASGCATLAKAGGADRAEACVATEPGPCQHPQ